MLLAPTPSTVALGCDFSGFAGMNGSPVQARRVATPWAAPTTAKGSWACIYRANAAALRSSPAGRATLPINPRVTLIFKIYGLCFIVWMLGICFKDSEKHSEVCMCA